MCANRLLTRCRLVFPLYRCEKVTELEVVRALRRSLPIDSTQVSVLRAKRKSAPVVELIFYK